MFTAKDGARFLVGVLVLLGVVVGGAYGVLTIIDRGPLPLELVEATAANVNPRLVVGDAAPRTLDPYSGYGTWVDVFDFSPPYAGDNPPVSGADLDAMAAAGVRTVYLQAGRDDDRSPLGTEDPWLLAEWILGAHNRGMAVVAWYLPKWNETTDITRLAQLADFEVLGQRFDGVGLDIEWTSDDLEPEERSARLVRLSEASGEVMNGDPLSAIVLPPVLIEVVNEQFWPGFPWAEIAPYYDVWLPMSYWSFRSTSSGYGDGFSYNNESVERLRVNVRDADAIVHSIGGIGGVDGIDDPENPSEPLAHIDEMDAFARSVESTRSVGASIYDWNTLEPAVRDRLRDLFAAPTSP